MRLRILSAVLLIVGGCLGGDPGRVRLSSSPDLVDPAVVGMDARRLDVLTESLRAGTWGNVHALVITRHGRLIYEEYFEGQDERLGRSLGHRLFGPEELHDVRSISKTITSMLVGIAVERGELPPLDTPLAEVLPEYVGLLTGPKRAISLRHVLTMSAGLRWDEEALPYTDPRNDERRLSNSDDPTAFVLGQALVSAPGEAFNYCGGLSHVLGAALEAATGRAVDAYATDVLFQPLGIDRWEWMDSGHARPSTFSGLRLRALDLARLGLVCLDDGAWEGRQVLPRGWAAEATRAWISYPDDEAPSFVRASGYGYQWWTNRYETGLGELEVATAIGNGEQRLILVPELSLAVTVFAGFYNDPSHSWVPEEILVAEILAAIVER